MAVRAGVRGGPGRSRNFSHRQSFTTRWVHIRLFEPQWLFWPLDAPCCQGAACVSPKPKARAQVYCSTRCRMRGWRKDSTESACYGQKTIGEINGLRRANSAQTAAGSLEIAGHPTRSERLHGAPRNILGGRGWRWPGSMHVDATTQAKIVRAEVGATVAVSRVEGGAV